MLSAPEIVSLHDQLTHSWHLSQGPPQNQSDSWLALVARHHRANFDLWHIEDEARTPGATDSKLADAKRRIDSTTGYNDLSEQLDRTLLDWLAPQKLPHEKTPLHSESPGLMIDHHEEAERADASPEHTQRNHARLAILDEQRTDLARCLEILWRETLAGSRRFKLYRQLKMYNDPALNPAIYRNALSGSGS